VLLVGSFGANATLTALYPKDDPLVSASVEWFANGTKLASAQGSTLYLASELVGQTVSAKVTLRKAGFTDFVVDSPGAKVFDSLPTSFGKMNWNDESVDQPGCFAPRASGVSTPTIGWPIWFSCQPYNTNFGNQIDQKFWWYRNGERIDGATQSSYRLQSSDAGQAIWGAYQVTFPNGFVFSETKRLRSNVPFQIKLAKPTILGSLKVGASLLASTTGTDSLANLSYQWFSDYAPISGATSANHVVRQVDLGKALQVLVSAQREGHSPSSMISDPVADSTLRPFSPIDAYSAVFNGYKPSGANYDIKYVTAPSVSPETLAREMALVKRAADFWAPDFTPEGVTVVYVTKQDAAWAEELVRQNPSWINSIPGGIRSWIERDNCGFALAFEVEQKKVFIQCVRNGSDATMNDKQVGPHEYSHWVQYHQTPSLFLGTVPWLVEGQANFYGLALGIAPEDPNLKLINTSLAGHASQFDIYNGYRFAEFRLLDLFQTGNVFDIQTMLSRSGTVWDSYLVGTLASEWLVVKYGHQKYVNWMRELLQTKGQNNDSERVANSIAFRSVYGFDYSELGLHLTPYFAARAPQLRAAWAETQNNQNNVPNVQPTSSATVNTKQQLPNFSGKSSVLSSAQREWISKRVKDGPIRQITCTGVHSKTKTSKDLALVKLRAKNACQFAKTSLASIGSSASAVATSSTTTKTSEHGKVYLTFKG
jgi:hypothetical protein